MTDMKEYTYDELQEILSKAHARAQFSFRVLLCTVALVVCAAFIILFRNHLAPPQTELGDTVNNVDHHEQ